MLHTVVQALNCHTVIAFQQVRNKCRPVIPLTLTVLSLFCEIGHSCRTKSSKWVNWNFHLQCILTLARLARFLKLSIASAKLVSSKKLFNGKSNVHFRFYFPGKFLEMLGGGG